MRAYICSDFSSQLKKNDWNNLNIFVPRRETPDTMTTLASVFPDIFAYGVSQYIQLQDLQKLMLLNKEFHKMAKRIVYTNYDNMAILNRFESGMNIKMALNGIRYIDIIKSSVNYRAFDQIMDVIDTKSNEMQIAKLDLVFNYTIACKKIFTKELNEDMQLVQRLSIQTPIFEISETSHQDHDFRIFQFLLYLTVSYMHGKAGLIAKASIVQQIIQYFNSLYMLRLAAICSEESFAKLQKLSKSSIDSYNNVMLLKMMRNNIHKLDINLYDVYTLYLGELMRIAYTRYIPTSAINELQDFNTLYLKSYYQYVSGDKQVNTIGTLLEFVADRTYFRRVRLQLIAMIFHYIADIASNNIIAPCFISTYNKFFKTVLDRCEFLVEELQTSSDYRQEVVDVVVDILNQSKAIIEGKTSM